MYPVIVCVAKNEQFYIEEFIRYHIALGFKHIIIYDTESKPTYEELLKKYVAHVKVIHVPTEELNEHVSLSVLEDFKTRILYNSNITHVAHIDIDEFIVLKKHSTIIEFINKYLTGDCQGIGMNRIYFGSSKQTVRTNQPVTLRFTRCEELGNEYIKTIFKKDHFIKFNTVHDVALKEGHIKTIRGDIITGPTNYEADFSAIQLNCYKSKTFSEFKKQHPTKNSSEIENEFKEYDLNQRDDFWARDFYKRQCLEWDIMPKIEFH